MEEKLDIKNLISKDFDIETLKDMLKIQDDVLKEFRVFDEEFINRNYINNKLNELDF